MSARETPTARMGATTSMNIVTLEATDEDSAVRASTPPSALCRAVPFRARESYLLVFLHHFRHSDRPSRGARLTLVPNARRRSQPPDPSPFVIMRRADGRAFVIDAAGSAEITDASSAFLRALASAGTAPPRPNASLSDANANAATLETTTRAALPAPVSPPSRPRTRSATRREYFPRANRLYEALTGARRRRDVSFVDQTSAERRSEPESVSAEREPIAPASSTEDPGADASATRALSPGSLDRRLSLDGRHVGDATGLRRRRRRLDWREGERDDDATTTANALPTSLAEPMIDRGDRNANAGTSGVPPPRRAGGPRAGGLDIARVARELGESLHATRRGAMDLGEEEEEDDAADGDVGRRRALRARVAFLADALLTILREVDARLLSEGNDDGLGLPQLLGFGQNAPADARDLEALAPTTVFPNAREEREGRAEDGDERLDDASETHASSELASLSDAPDTKGPTLPTFYGACGCDDDGSPQCYICLEEFHGGEEIRELPCRHAFHRKCVDKWLLRSSRRCPTCRAEVPRVARAERAERRAPGIGADANPDANGAVAWREPPRRVLALPPARPNLFFLPAPEGFEAAAPERTASPVPRATA